MSPEGYILSQCDSDSFFGLFFRILLNFGTTNQRTRILNHMIKEFASMDKKVWMLHYQNDDFLPSKIVMPINIYWFFLLLEALKSLWKSIFKYFRGPERTQSEKFCQKWLQTLNHNYDWRVITIWTQKSL